MVGVLLAILVWNSGSRLHRRVAIVAVCGSGLVWSHVMGGGNHVQ